jgi:predicted nucleotide-binding protein
LNNKQLESVIEAYYNDERFFCNGSFIQPSEIETIQIYETQMTSENLSTKHAKLSLLGPFSKSFFVQKYGKNITRLRIKHPPKKRKRKIRNETQVLSKNVFIVHGRDRKPMKELQVMLKEFGFNPIVLHEQPSGSRTIVEKLEKYSDVGYAFVILTPDDLGTSDEEFDKYNKNFVEELAKFRQRKQTEDETKRRLAENVESFIENRARQNVVLEFGYFIGKLDRDRVCCLLKGDVERPSDMHGIVYKHFKESLNEVKDEIVKELKAAGYGIRI